MNCNTKSNKKTGESISLRITPRANSYAVGLLNCFEVNHYEITHRDTTRDFTGGLSETSCTKAFKVLWRCVLILRFIDDAKVFPTTALNRRLDQAPWISTNELRGLHDHIEPWWTLKTPGLACQCFQTRWAWSPSADEFHRDGKQARAKPPQRIGGHTYSSGLDVETQIFSPSGRGGAFFLDIHFYRTH